MILYPTPNVYRQVPCIKDLSFFFLMSPDYGETASLKLPDGRVLIVSKTGRLTGVLPSGDKTGTYSLSTKTGSDDIVDHEEYLNEEQANLIIESLWRE